MVPLLSRATALGLFKTGKMGFNVTPAPVAVMGGSAVEEPTTVSSIVGWSVKGL